MRPGHTRQKCVKSSDSNSSDLKSSDPFSPVERHGFTWRKDANQATSTTSVATPSSLRKERSGLARPQRINGSLVLSEQRPQRHQPSALGHRCPPRAAPSDCLLGLAPLCPYNRRNSHLPGLCTVFNTIDWETYLLRPLKLRRTCHLVNYFGCVKRWVLSDHRAKQFGLAFFGVDSTAGLACGCSSSGSLVASNACSQAASQRRKPARRASSKRQSASQVRDKSGRSPAQYAHVRSQARR